VSGIATEAGGFDGFRLAGHCWVVSSEEGMCSIRLLVLRFQPQGRRNSDEVKSLIHVQVP
jgi:hypothetical protein